jgi:predicted nucleic acid-binding protein
VNAVIDTNVVAYYLLNTPGFANEARAFVHALDDAWAPALWEAELTNVLWMSVRHKVVSIQDAATRLALAGSLGIHSVSNRSLWLGALVRAHESKVAVYDTLFVELALRENLPLVTFDASLIKAFPNVAVRPSALRH